MADFFSARFNLDVVVTHHAHQSMRKRDVSMELLALVLEQGEIKRKTSVDCWVFQRVQGRADNLVCAAVALESALIIKTVMINWELEDEQ